MRSENHVYAPYDDGPEPLSRTELEWKAIERQERYDAAFARALSDSAFWRDLDETKIIAAVRASVTALGMSPMDRHLIILRGRRERARRLCRAGSERRGMIEWIPVAERCPEDHENVLVYFGDHVPQEVCYRFAEGKYGVGWHNALTCAFIDCEPTHWMPLPEPPK